MTIALEHIQPDDWAAVNRVVDALRSLVIDTGGVSLGVRGGTGTVTWPGGSRLTTATTITHGLGRTPTRILLTSTETNMAVTYASAGVTTFTVTGNTIDGGSPANGTQRTFSWEAKG